MFFTVSLHYYLILSSMSMYGFDQNSKIYLERQQTPRLPCWQSDSWSSPQCCLRQPLLSKSLPVDFWAQKPHPLQLSRHCGQSELRAEKSRSASDLGLPREGLPPFSVYSKGKHAGAATGLCICRFTPVLPVLPGVRRLLLTTHPGRSHPLGRGGLATKNSLLICLLGQDTMVGVGVGHHSVTCI